MKYALLGDLHSNIEDTQAVLTHIKQQANDAIIIGLGDLFECLIGKKKACKMRGLPLQQAAIVSEQFELLLTFPSIRGNQEERITQVTGLRQFMQYPESISIPNATLLHGHQIEWNEQWEPIQFPNVETPLLFFGHSHESAIYEHYHKIAIQHHIPYSVAKKHYAINVGSVVVHREWCLYDASKQEITFMKSV